MTGTAERRKSQTFEERKNYIKSICLEVETRGLPNLKNWRPPKKLFSDFSDSDFDQLALGSLELNVNCVLDGPALTPGEVVTVIFDALHDKNPEREKPGNEPSKILVTVNHILFQFYLIKRALNAAAK